MHQVKYKGVIQVNIPAMVQMTTSKHVAALKRLIALARSVGYVLGRAWVPVLEVFEASFTCSV